MTTTIGTFIPVHTHHSHWNSTNARSGLNHGNQYGISGLNTHPHSSIMVIPTSGYGLGATVGWHGNQHSHQGAVLGYVPHNAYTLNGYATDAALVGISGHHQGNQDQDSLNHSFATELSENNCEYVVSFDVPGIEIGDLDISLTGNTIHIHGIRKGSQEGSTLAYSEVARGHISRAISLPFDLSPSKAINTSLENGVLKIRIAKENHTGKKSASRKVKIG